MTSPLALKTVAERLKATFVKVMGGTPDDGLSSGGPDLLGDSIPAPALDSARIDAPLTAFPCGELDDDLIHQERLSQQCVVFGDSVNQFVKLDALARGLKRRNPDVGIRRRLKRTVLVSKRKAL